MCLRGGGGSRKDERIDEGVMSMEEARVGRLGMGGEI